MAVAFSDAEIRSILLEHRYLATADAICAKWGITRSRLREWKRDHGFAYVRGDLRELVIVALWSGPAREPADVVSFLDWQDHAVYSPDEIRRVLDALVVEGRAVRRGGAWHYDKKRLARSRRPFVF